MAHEFTPSTQSLGAHSGRWKRRASDAAHRGRSKPARTLQGTYRIIDFVLSNFYNSGITAIHVMVQYRSQSLIEHLRRAWRIGDGKGSS